MNRPIMRGSPRSKPAPEETDAKKSRGNNEQVVDYLFCDGHVRARPPGKYTPGLPFGATWEEAREWFVDKEAHRHLWPE